MLFVIRFFFFWRYRDVKEKQGQVLTIKTGISIDIILNFLSSVVMDTCMNLPRLRKQLFKPGYDNRPIIDGASYRLPACMPPVSKLADSRLAVFVCRR